MSLTEIVKTDHSDFCRGGKHCHCHLQWRLVKKNVVNWNWLTEQYEPTPYKVTIAVAVDNPAVIIDSTYLKWADGRLISISGQKVI